VLVAKVIICDFLARFVDMICDSLNARVTCARFFRVAVESKRLRSDHSGYVGHLAMQKIVYHVKSVEVTRKFGRLARREEASIMGGCTAVGFRLKGDQTGIDSMRSIFHERHIP
jgi:hypothetical protein